MFPTVKSITKYLIWEETETSLRLKSISVPTIAILDSLKNINQIDVVSLSPDSHQVIVQYSFTSEWVYNPWGMQSVVSYLVESARQKSRANLRPWYTKRVQEFLTMHP